MLIEKNGGVVLIDQRIAAVAIVGVGPAQGADRRVVGAIILGAASDLCTGGIKPDSLELDGPEAGVERRPGRAAVGTNE
jgi:hypothetical protein